MKQLSPFSLNDLQQQASDFAQSLSDFLQKNPQLLTFIENKSIDHLAIKSTDSTDYELFLNSVIPHSLTPVTFTPMDNRRIATAQLKESIIFPNYGKTNILEIIEPKPEKSGIANAKFDHIEIRNPNFPEIEKVLKKLRLAYTLYQNPNHKALVIVINDLDQEIKFTNSNLSEIVQQELKDGHAFTV